MKQPNSMMKKQTIKVAVRVRPVLAEELQKGHNSTRDKMKLEGNTNIKIMNKQSHVKSYEFDQVFDESSTQESIFRRTRADFLIKQVLIGFHATIFVYGQTGSGKTYTMEGYKYAAQGTNNVIVPQINRKTATDQQAIEEEGVIPRAIRELFSQIEAKRAETEGKSKITVKIQYIQLYNEKVYDLLNSNSSKAQKIKKGGHMANQGLKLKMNAMTDEVTIENVYIFECATLEDAYKYFWKGLKNKVMSSHNMNQSSSRSHCILTFIVQQEDLTRQSDASSTPQIVSKLQLVDLAGSERQSHTTLAEATQDSTQFKEAIEINKSLFTLRQVITALTENSSSSALNKQRSTSSTAVGHHQTGGSQNKVMNYVPYRESKLTTILKQSLGGNSFTLMIACLAPIDLYTEENISTLNYAARAAKISNAPSINMDPRLKQIMEQKRTIERLKQELKRANDQVRFLTMGGCTCKLGEQNSGAASAGLMSNRGAAGVSSPTNSGTESSKLMQQSFKSAQTAAAGDNNNAAATGLTINNNYNNNTISIIDGNTITTTTTQSGANAPAQQTAAAQHHQNSSSSTGSKMGSGIVMMSDHQNDTETKQDNITMIGGEAGTSKMKKDRSGMLPKLASNKASAQMNSADTAKTLMSNSGGHGDAGAHFINASSDFANMQARKPYQHQMMNQTVSTLLTAADASERQTNNAADGPSERNGSTSGTNKPARQINFSITQSQFNAMQDQVRSKLGLTMPMLGNHANQVAAPYSQDRLIASISIIKEVLISNMQLREDLLSVSQEHENTMQTNFQLTIENEDLRERLNLANQTDGTSIDYMPYLEHRQLEKNVNRIQSSDELQQVKNMILTHVHSLKKDNRQLKRRIQNFEDKYQERKAKRKQSRGYTGQNQSVVSHQDSMMTDQSQRACETENSIELYPELGPHAPLIQDKKPSMRYGTSKDGQSASVQRKSTRNQFESKPPKQSSFLAQESPLGFIKTSKVQQSIEMRAASVDNHEKDPRQQNHQNIFNRTMATGEDQTIQTKKAPFQLNSNQPKVKNHMHRKLIAIDHQGQSSIIQHQTSRQTPDYSKVSQSQNFYALPANDTTFGPASPLATDSAAFTFDKQNTKFQIQQQQQDLGEIVAGITSGQTKLAATQRQTIDASPIRVPASRRIGNHHNVVQKSVDRGSEHKNGSKKKNRMIYQLPQVTMNTVAAAGITASTAAGPTVGLQLQQSQSSFHKKVVNQSVEITRSSAPGKPPTAGAMAASTIVAKTHRAKSKNGGHHQHQLNIPMRNNQNIISNTLNAAVDPQQLSSNLIPVKNLIHGNHQNQGTTAATVAQQTSATLTKTSSNRSKRKLVLPISSAGQAAGTIVEKTASASDNKSNSRNINKQRSNAATPDLKKHHKKDGTSASSSRQHHLQQQQQQQQILKTTESSSQGNMSTIKNRLQQKTIRGEPLPQQQNLATIDSTNNQKQIQLVRSSSQQKHNNKISAAIRNQHSASQQQNQYHEQYQEHKTDHDEDGDFNSYRVHKHGKKNQNHLVNKKEVDEAGASSVQFYDNSEIPTDVHLESGMASMSKQNRQAVIDYIREQEAKMNATGF